VKRREHIGAALLGLALAALPAAAAPAPEPACGRTVTARVVALDQPIVLNRLGTVLPSGMIFALERDVVPLDPALGLAPGNVQLRAGRRPRPLVLRVNEGDCLRITFRNLLRPGARAPWSRPPAAPPFTSWASSR